LDYLKLLFYSEYSQGSGSDDIYMYIYIYIYIYIYTVSIYSIQQAKQCLLYFG